MRLCLRQKVKVAVQVAPGVSPPRWAVGNVRAVAESVAGGSDSGGVTSVGQPAFTGLTLIKQPSEDASCFFVPAASAANRTTAAFTSVGHEGGVHRSGVLPSLLLHAPLALAAATSPSL